jgi:hypothetical protein
MVMRIATGEETEELETDRARSVAAELGSRGGKAAGSEDDARTASGGHRRRIYE